MNALTKKNCELPVYGDSVIKNFFDGDFSFPFQPKQRLHSTLPAVNISESETKYSIELAVPGMDKQAIAIEVKENLLSVSAEKPAESSEKKETQNFRRREFSYTKFRRNFTLPENANDKAIQASCADGILTIHIPKKEIEKGKSRLVKIS